jgi:Zn-dependent M28 family amino/carboxypeptidase
MRFLIIALATLTLATSAQAQQAHEIAPISAAQQRNVERLRAAALESDLAWSIVESLVTEVGPRLAGSGDEARARDWAAAMLRANGFSNVRVEPFTLPYWDATREDAQIVGHQRMVIAALGGSPSTPAGGVEAEVVRFADLAALEAATEQELSGRIAFIDEPMERTRNGAGYGVAVRKRGLCAPRAQARGAVACLIRSVGTDTHRFAHQGGNSRQAEGASLPAAALSPADADVLARLIAHGPTRVRLTIEAEMRDNAPSGNVIAEIPGRTRRNEIVLAAAHLDSWDLGQGAIDDGAGVAIITAAAALVNELPGRPRRTIRVLFAGSEENGVHGGAAYGAAHANERHIVASESDFGAGRVWAFRLANPETSGPYARAIQQALAPLGVDLDATTPARGGADVGAIGQAGSPLADLAQDGTDYFDRHHTANDTLYAIDPEALRQNVAAWAVFLYLVADSDWEFGE